MPRAGRTGTVGVRQPPHPRRAPGAWPKDHKKGTRDAAKTLCQPIRAGYLIPAASRGRRGASSAPSAICLVAVSPTPPVLRPHVSGHWRPPRAEARRDPEPASPPWPSSPTRARNGAGPQPDLGAAQIEVRVRLIWHRTGASDLKPCSRPDLESAPYRHAARVADRPSPTPQAPPRRPDSSVSPPKSPRSAGPDRSDPAGKQVGLMSTKQEHCQELPSANGRSV